MNHLRRIGRRLVPWVACFALGWALAAWLLTDPYPAPWQTIAGTVAGVILLTLVVIDLEHLDRRREREAIRAEQDARAEELIARYRRTRPPLEEPADD